MAVTCAVILAAGMGSRLMPLTADRPKALVEVGGKTLLERVLDACAAAGLDEAIVVTGYCHHAVEAWLEARSLPARVTLLHNPEYATRGNAWSLYLARDALAGRSFVKLDGDLLLEHGLIAGLLAAPWRSAIALDGRADVDAEAMKAAVDERGRVTALGKWLALDQSAGESIGIEKIDARDGAAVFDALLATVGADESAYYEDAYHRLLGQGFELGAFDIGALRWTEIDDARDFGRAERLLQELGS
jgi:choline kinase